MSRETSFPDSAVLNVAPSPMMHFSFAGIAELRFAPLPLTHSLADDPGSPLKPNSLPRKIFVLALKGVAAIAAGVAILCPLSTSTEILVFVASLAVAITCYVVLTHMDETHVDESGNNGYWPKPLNWNSLAKSQGLAKENTTGK